MMTAEETNKTDVVATSDDANDKKGWIYRQMVHYPAPFMLILPIIFVIFIAVGWVSVKSRSEAFSESHK